jgi:hypothetical protein
VTPQASLTFVPKRIRDAIGFAVFLFCFTPFGEAQESPPWKISVSGNSKTQSSFVEDLTNKCLNEIDAGDFEFTQKLEQCIKNSRLFSSVKVLRSEFNQLNVAVAERWTLLVFPVVSANNSSRSSLGLFAVESNFLGLGKQLIFGGNYSETGTSFVVIGSDRNIGATRWQGQALALRSQRYYELKPHSTTLDAFDEQRTTMGVGAGYAFPSKWTPQVSIDFSSEKHLPHLHFPASKNQQSARLQSHLRWSNRAYKLYFESGLQFSLSSSNQIWRSNNGPHAWNGVAALQLGTNPFLDHALQHNCQAQALVTGDKRDAPKLGGGPGLRGFAQQTVWTKRLISCATDYQIPFYHASYGTWTTAPLFDFGWLSLATQQTQSFSYATTGIGAYLFLNQITVPGMGFACFQNHHTKALLCQFSIGMNEGTRNSQ